MKVVVAGASGFIGMALVKRLVVEDHVVVALSRKSNVFKNLPSENLQEEIWDGQTLGPWIKHMEDADAVVNLAGEGIADKRWDLEQKRIIKGSRLGATKAVVGAIARSQKRPQVLVNASAVGYYGSAGDTEIMESSPKGKGFLADVCSDWEQEARVVEELGLRVVLLRIGVVMEKDGGALKKLMRPFRFFIGGPLGSGRQWFPWVHREDVVGAILYILKNESLSGPVNVVAPETQTMKRPCWAPVPASVLRMSLGGEMADMLLGSQRVLPHRLLESGYTFRYPSVSDALKKILKK